ncbi:MAG: Branched-chain amino acid transport [Chloroflexi bacterium]|nr:MAG: Branched-chain amino acid transport [Chloroflexota bacterium]MBA4374895.1 AzlD domain-containing protein [Anaerolinea sp.]
MTDTAVLITLLGMALVTYLPRVLPAWFLRGRKLHPFVEAWLKYVPVAVLAALLLPSLLVDGGKFKLAWDNLYLWAALPAGLTAWKTRSMFATVLVGMAVVALARLLI